MSLWWWRAVYDDGSTLDQNPGISSEHIDRDRLRRFELRYGDADIAALVIDRPAEMRLVFRRRTELTNGVPRVVHLLGFNAPDGLHMMLVDENGQVHPEPEPDIQLVPCEEL